MPNPILTKDLYKNTGELTELEEQLLSVEKTYLGLVENIKRNAIKLNAELGRTTTGTASQREEIKKSAVEADRLSKAIANYNKALDENAEQIALVREETRKQNQINKLQVKLNASLEGSYDKLSAQYSINKIRLNAMSAAHREASEEGQKLVKETAEIREEMNRLQKATGNYTLQVGNYTLVNDRLISQLEQMPGLTGDLASGVSSVGQQFSILLRNPLVAIFSALAVAVTQLGKAFFRSEKGAELMARGTATVNALFSSLTKVATNVVQAIDKAFMDPVMAIKDFGNAIVENVFNRLKAFPIIFGAIGRSLSALASGDLARLKESAQEAAQAFVQLGSGVSIEQQNKFAQSIADTTKAINEEISAWQALELARLNTIKANRGLARSIEEITTREEVLNQVAGDATLSFKEREEAAEAARAEIEKRAKLQIQLERNNLALINEEIRLRKANGEAVSDLLDEQLDAYRSLITSERELTLAVAQNETERRQLKQDELERDLDILIDGFENQKMINERLLQNEKLTIEERARLLRETQGLADRSFEQQIKTIQEFTDVQVNANELVAESDAVVLNQKIRNLGLSEIIEGRLLEIVRERRIVTLDLLEAEEELNAKRAEAAAKELALQQRLNQESIQNGLERFDQEQALALERFKGVERTEAELTRFRLEQERARLAEMLDLNEEFFGDLSDLQIETFQTRIDNIGNSLAALAGGSAGTERRSLFDLIGIDFSQEQLTGLKSAFDFAKSQLLEFASLRTQIADQDVQRSQNRVNQLQQELQTQLELDRQGYASRVDTVRRELALAQETQQKALEEQEKARRQEQRIAAAQQAVQLVLASAKIWGQLGFPFAIPALAIMWGSFAAAQVRASQLTKREFSEGGYEELGGGSHRSGNDTYLFTDNAGRPSYGEAGEAHAVFTAKAVKKYGRDLPGLVDQINKGDFQLKYINNIAGSIPVEIGARGGTDMTTTEGYLAKIAEQGEQKVYYSPDGSMTIVMGNRRMTFKKSA